MRRVLVIGAPGSGKSTLATRLAATLGVPVHYLDRHYWKPGWQYRDAADARERVRGIAETPAWVMDGNFSDTFDLRMPRADSLIWLDYRRATCISPVLLRARLGQGGEFLGHVGPASAPRRQPDLAGLPARDLHPPGAHARRQGLRPVKARPARRMPGTVRCKTASLGLGFPGQTAARNSKGHRAIRPAPERRTAHQ